ncbi:MAG: FAD-binding protein, partial [Atopobiaceae bacterium]|nr:FAD-binding protein [Atopobiaceae bacterium]
MLDISDIRVPLKGLDGSEEKLLGAVRTAACHALRLDPSSISSAELRRRSVDARKRSDVHLVVSLRVTLSGGMKAENALLERASSKRLPVKLKRVEEHPELLPPRTSNPLDSLVLVVGAGAAGLFCSLALANAGLHPILIERGDDASRRKQAVSRFEETGVLDTESNIQFGLGGAGTFSDGKLYTGTRASTHRLILETFVEAGASRSILYDAHPHIGSDVLPSVVEHIRSRIIDLGGEVRLRTRLVDLVVQGASIKGAVIESEGEDGILREERLNLSHLVLATGHSARDVYELLDERGVALERKPFAMGVRIEHLQADIDAVQYGSRFAGHPELGASPYKLAVHVGNRGAFSFCMCPGGYVVAAASERDAVVTNGMSLAKREGVNANSGLLVGVDPTDLDGDSVLAGIELQRACEHAAFEAGGGAYVAPAQLVGDFLQGVPSTQRGAVGPSYPRGVRWTTLEGLLPRHVTDTLRAALPLMDRKLSGFASSDAVLTGIESRSSSPVRIVRGPDMRSVSHAGLYPVGEGAGYAGGIMSAAADGLRA